MRYRPDPLLARSQAQMLKALLAPTPETWSRCVRLRPRHQSLRFACGALAASALLWRAIA
jgi:hypothetical protein